MVWDYHVVLVLRRRVQCAEQDPGPREDGQQQTEMAEDAWVYDLDTRLAVPSKGTGASAPRATASAADLSALVSSARSPSRVSGQHIPVRV